MLQEEEDIYLTQIHNSHGNSTPTVIAGLPENPKVNNAGHPYNTKAEHTVYIVASVVCRRRLTVTLCIVAERCVLEQQLLLTAYEVVYERNRLVPK